MKDKMIEFGVINEEIKDTLIQYMNNGKSILISGCPKSKPESFLNYLFALNRQQEDVCENTKTKTIKSAIDIVTCEDLTKEVAHNFIISSVGKKRKIASIYADSPELAIYRLINMVGYKESVTAEILALLEKEIDIIIQLSIMPDKSRKLSSIHRLTNIKNEKVKTEPIFQWKIQSFNEDKRRGEWFRFN